MIFGLSLHAYTQLHVLISLVAIAAVVGVYLAVHNHGHGNSPA